MLTQVLINGLFLSSIISSVAIGFGIVYGIARIMNWAHGEFYMLGAVGIWFFALQLKIHLSLSIILTLTVIIVFSLIIERTIFKRLRGLHLPGFVASYGLLLFLQGTVFIGLKGNPKTFPKIIDGVLNIGEAYISWQRILTIPIVIITLAIVFWFMKKTKYGIAIRAGIQDVQAAKLYGLKMDSLCSIAMALAAGLAAFSGILVAPLFSIEPYMGSFIMWNAWLSVCLGGRGNLGGCLIVSVLLGFMISFVETYLGAYYTYIISAGFLLIGISIRPRGLWEGMET